MASKLQRAMADWEKAKVRVENRTENDCGTKVTLELDQESLKALQGTTKWVNDTEIGRDEATVRMFAERVLRYWLALLSGFEWEGRMTDLGKKIFADTCNKIIFSTKHVDGVNHHKDRNCHHISKNGKTWTWQVDIDYTRYISQQPPDLRHVVKEILEAAGTNYHFLHRKIGLDAKLQEVQGRLNAATGKPLPLQVDIDGISKIQGKCVLKNDVQEPASGAALFAIQEEVLMGVYWAIEKICKNNLGKEAFAKAFTAIVIHAEAGQKGINIRKWEEHKLEKQGTELHLTMRFDFEAYLCHRFPSDDMAKAIEELL